MKRTILILMMSVWVVGVVGTQNEKELRGRVLLLDANGENAQPVEGVSVTIQQT